MQKLLLLLESFIHLRVHERELESMTQLLVDICTAMIPSCVCVGGGGVKLERFFLKNQGFQVKSYYKTFERERESLPWQSIWKSAPFSWSVL